MYVTEIVITTFVRYCMRMKTSKNCKRESFFNSRLTSFTRVFFLRIFEVYIRTVIIPRISVSRFSENKRKPVSSC